MPHSSPRRVVVVGAGMVGLATAWHLQEEGVEVTVLDRQGVAAGSSWGNAGWLAPALTLPLNDPAILASGMRSMLKSSSPVYVPPTADPRLLRFLVGFVRHCTPGRWRAAMEVFNRVNAHALDAFAQLDVSEATKPAEPFLAGFASETDRQVLETEFEHVREWGGTTDYELLTEDEIKKLEPTLGAGVTHGIALHGQRFINPGRYVHALADAVVARGATLRTDVVAERVDDTGSVARVVAAGGETFEADHVVVATGAWLGGLVRPHGVKAIVQAGRGYSFTVQPEVMPTNPVYFPIQRVACTPLGTPDAPAGFRVAGMMEFRKPDAALDPRRVKAIVDAARPMLTGVDWDARTDEWVGSRPCTVDGLPLIGRTRSPRVSVNGGHGMWGIALGPLSGRLLARDVTGRETDPVLTSFDPLR
ncbi:NAD(P)/FAD-dependent oxidoreductase [Aeromicrobium massiliense]|uniref:NAD(P)/FAD-dependent oxidoreductase n=1 Tax=Aeromicrobium massiliense TaxID=1464554 RepID=UPI0002E6A7BD|nr:FAD-dependent oxidoreductase [Aeromicrobium massiliense]